jgi:hypothetical protein
MQLAPGPILSDSLRMTVVGLQLMALRARRLKAVAQSRRTGKRDSKRSSIIFAQQVCSIYKYLSGHVATVSVDPLTGRSGGSAIMFYQRICELAIDKAGVSEVAGWLKSRAISADASATDIRSAKGGSPRKR